nr:MAG TPA: hypothetical protein [Caudoviricetes sp.]
MKTTRKPSTARATLPGRGRTFSARGKACRAAGRLPTTARGRRRRRAKARPTGGQPSRRRRGLSAGKRRSSRRHAARGGARPWNGGT